MPKRYPNDDPPLRHIIDDVLTAVAFILGICIAYGYFTNP
jgi:hypothetical protein